MNSLLASRIAQARAALRAHGSGEGENRALVLPREPGAPVAFFVSLAPRTLKPRLDVEIECELLVYPVIAGRSSIGCRSSHADVVFRGVRMRSRFQGSGLEGHQWVVDASAGGVVLARETSTNGTRMIRDGVEALLPPQTWSFLPLRDGDVLVTVYESWIFAMLA